MYEGKLEAPVSGRVFIVRLLWHAFAAVALLLGSLLAGVFGYVVFEAVGIVDAFLNSAMLLGGMGLVDPPQSTGGKLFAGFYALYSGLVFVVIAAIIFTPIIHRALHRFHWDTDR